MNSGHTVSVIVPVRNRAEIIGAALRSAVEQAHGPREIILVDDCSDDDPLATAELICGPLLRYLRLPEHRNAAYARNAGADLATGDVLAFLDSDDVWLPDHLQAKLAMLDGDPNADAVFGGFYEKPDGRDRLTRVPTPMQTNQTAADYVLTVEGIRTSGFVVKRNAFMTVRFDDELEKHQDWDFFIRFAVQHRWLRDATPRVVLGTSRADRMSVRPNYGASGRFAQRHGSSLSVESRARFYAALAAVTVRAEGRTEKFKSYWKQIPWALASGYGPLGKKLLLALPYGDTGVGAAQQLLRRLRALRP